MKKSVFVSCLLLCLTTISYGQRASETQNNKKLAQTIWEQAIEAKGGRRKLLSIRSMVVTSRSKVRYSMFKTYESVLERVYIFPDRAWSWEDERPSVFGVSMEMFNFRDNLKYYVVLRSKDHTGVVPIDLSEQQGLHLASAIPLLLETFWLKPTVIKVVRQTKDGDVIQNSLDNIISDFTFDRKTHFLKGSNIIASIRVLKKFFLMFLNTMTTLLLTES